jgi:hypothetical protein
VFVSPAAAHLLERAGPADLGDRFPGEIVGTIGDAGLMHGDEVAVVVGRAPDALTAPDGAAMRRDDGLADVPADLLAGTTEPIDTFASSGTTSMLDTYGVLAQMAAVLLVVPTLYLLGAAARLTAAQREQRLATLRLAGATPGTVITLTAIETAASALLGALVGIAGYLAILPSAARIELGGAPFPVADLRLGVGALVLTALVVPALAAASAVAALRQVAIGPLGVRRRTTPDRPSYLRFLVVPAAWFLLIFSAMSMRDGGSSVGALIGLGAVISTLAVIGPWLTYLLGALLRLVARRAPATIAARRISSDPKGTYRTVSGMVLSGLIAGFLFGVIPTIAAADRDSVIGDHVAVATATAADRIRIRAEIGEAVPGAVALDANQVEALRDGPGGLPARVLGDLDHLPYLDADQLAVGVIDPADLDRARTAILRAAPEATLESDAFLTESETLLVDLQRASVIMAAAALAMAVTAIAISTSASILDQRETLSRLRLIGVPVSVLQRARRWQVILPLGTASIGAMAFGAAAGLTMLMAFGASSDRVAAPDTTSMAVLGAGALLAGVAVVAATRPLLLAVSKRSPRE